MQENQIKDKLSPKELENSDEHFLDIHWKNINLNLISKKVGENDRPILKDLTGYSKHGEMLAIMGPTGFFML